MRSCYKGDAESDVEIGMYSANCIYTEKESDEIEKLGWYNLMVKYRARRIDFKASESLQNASQEVFTYIFLVKG